VTELKLGIFSDMVGNLSEKLQQTRYVKQLANFFNIKSALLSFLKQIWINNLTFDRSTFGKFLEMGSLHVNVS